MRSASTMFLALFLMTGIAGAGVITISELFYDAAGPDDGLTFVEIYGPPGMLLDGVVLVGVNGRDGAITHQVAMDGYRIPADRFLVLADGFSGGGTGVPEADHVIQALDFQNGPDSVVLLSGGAVLDALGYGTFGPGDVFSGEGRPAVEGIPGSSLARWYADVDTDDNLLDFHVESVPSPGIGNLAGADLVAPEPEGLVLFGLGVAGILAAARHRSRRRVIRSGSGIRRACRSSSP